MKKKLLMTLGTACVLGTTFAGTGFAATATDVETSIEQDSAAKQVYFELKDVSVRTDGYVGSEPEGLMDVINKYIGKQVSINDITKLKNEITVLYRQQGFLAATAYVPEQEIEDGHVTVKVMDGYLNSINLFNDAKLDDKILTGKASVFSQGEVVTDKKVEDLLYDINSINGVKATGELVPGEIIGTTMLNIKVEDTKRNNGLVYTDNYGSESSGKYRLGVLGNFYNVDKHGTDMTVGGLISDKDMHNYFFDVNTMVKPYAAKTKIGFSVDRSSYELGNEYAKLDANGDSTTYKLYGKTTNYETMKHGLGYSYGFKYKDIRDSLDAFNLSSDKHSHSFYAGMNGHDRWKDNLLNYSLTGTAGVHVNDSEYALFLNQYNHTDGAFWKIEGEANYYNLISPRWTFKNTTRFQLADKNLDSSEKMSIGGVNGVRAYPNGEFSADLGIVSQNAISYQTGDPNFTVDLFVDAAHATDKYTDDSAALFGYGLELNYSKANDYFAKLSYARRIGQYDGVSKEAESDGRFWFLAGKMF